jgi:hyperosmotically inducible periplasmic protein
MQRLLGVWGVVVVGLGIAIGVAARADQPAARADEPAERELMKTEKQIQANLQSDRDLANNRIDVQVSDGVATLKGTVDSEAERSRAVRLAGIAGVRIVDDQLKVESVGLKATVSDGAVTTKIKAQFLANTDLRSADIKVSTNNGVVTLTGTVPSQELRALAVDLARHTGGVARVDDQLRVVAGPGSPPMAPSR